MKLDPRSWDFWVAFGLAGQLLFGSRFIVQWIVVGEEEDQLHPDRVLVPLAVRRDRHDDLRNSPPGPRVHHRRRARG